MREIRVATSQDEALRLARRNLEEENDRALPGRWGWPERERGSHRGVSMWGGAALTSLGTGA